MNKNKSSDRTFVVGVVGGIASGKSNFSNVMQSLGAVRIDADAIGHGVLRRPLVLRRIVQLLGRGVLDSRGQIDRARLADVVFANEGSDTAALDQLEDIVHPLIHAEAVQRLRTLKEAGEFQVVVIDAPLLLESGWSPLCDSIVFVDTPASVRLARAQARGWTEAHWKSREAAQLPLSDKRARANHTVNGELDASQLNDLCSRMVDEAKRQLC